MGSSDNKMMRVTSLSLVVNRSLPFYEYMEQQCKITEDFVTSQFAYYPFMWRYHSRILKKNYLGFVKNYTTLLTVFLQIWKATTMIVLFIGLSLNWGLHIQFIFVLFYQAKIWHIISSATLNQFTLKVVQW